jgi:hypothetical protein
MVESVQRGWFIVLEPVFPYRGFSSEA